jgi:AcrR family transcriptional regulator
MTAPTTTIGRPRSAAADEAIREATLELLADHGYAGLTMSGVAAQAGVSSATLYRRWRSKVELVVAVLLARSDEEALPDTGSLREDLRSALRQLIDAKQDEQSIKIISAVVGELGRNPELASAFRTSLIAPRRAQFAVLFERAAGRGEISATADFELATDLVFGPIYQRLLITGRPLTRRVANDLIELILKALQ